MGAESALFAPRSLFACAQTGSNRGFNRAVSGETYMLMTARTTSLPFVSVTVTGTPMFSAPAHSVLSSRAVAVTSVSAFARYSMVMPRGIQRMPTGIVTSVHMPAASSQRLPMASACTVPM